MVLEDGPLVVDHEVIAPEGEQDKAGIVSKGLSGQLLDGIVVLDFFDKFFDQVPVVVKADDVGGLELGVVGDNGPGRPSFLAGHDTAEGFGGKIGIESDGIDFGDPHPVFEALSTGGARVDGVDQILVLLLIVFQHGEKSDALALQKLEISARPETAIDA